jgi:hypothetical protein
LNRSLFIMQKSLLFAPQGVVEKPRARVAPFGGTVEHPDLELF